MSIKSLLQGKNDQLRRANYSYLIFTVLELILVSAVVTFTLYVYLLLDRLSLDGLAVYGLYSQAANTLVAFVTLGLLIDSFVRIV